MLKNKWTDKQPELPTCKPSNWCWFLREGEKEAIVMELHPDRKHYPPGLWWTGPLTPRPPNPTNKNS
jgi:hypothetical protein